MAGQTGVFNFNIDSLDTSSHIRILFEFLRATSVEKKKIKRTKNSIIQIFVFLLLLLHFPASSFHLCCCCTRSLSRAIQAKCKKKKKKP